MAQTAVAAGLLAGLRQATSRHHIELERETGLPDTIRSRADYVRTLRWLLRAHAACERVLGGGAGWDALRLAPPAKSRAGLIASDLAALGAAGAAPPALDLEVTGTGGCVGVIYVVQGSALGALRMAPVVEERLGRPPGDATRFLRAGGSATGPAWREVTDALSRWGDRAGASERKDALDGACAAFDAFRRAARDV